MRKFPGMESLEDRKLVEYKIQILAAPRNEEKKAVHFSLKSVFKCNV